MTSIRRAGLRAAAPMSDRARWAGATRGADHWAAIDSTPGLQGGFIRESGNHAILRRVSEGRPAGRTGAGPYDNGATAPGRRWAYGGDLGDHLAEPDPHPRRESAAPVRIHCYRHEGIVVANHRRFPGLAGLAATWELTPAGGRTLTAPAELPDLRPGETAAVPLPFALPKDGGAAWLTLRVVTARDEPSAPRGTEVCAPRIRLRAAARDRAVPPSAGPPVPVDDDLLVHPLPTAAPVHLLPTAAPVVPLQRARVEAEPRGVTRRPIPLLRVP